MRKLNSLPSASNRKMPSCDRIKQKDIPFSKLNLGIVGIPIKGNQQIASPLPNIKYPNVFDGTSRHGDIVEHQGVLIKRVTGACLSCYLDKFNISQCAEKTNCLGGGAFKRHTPEQ